MDNGKDRGAASRYQKASDLLEVNPVLAFEEFSTLADEGNPDSMLQLALCYQYGIGVEADDNLAELWCRNAYVAGGGDIKKQAEENLFWLRLKKASALRLEEPSRVFEEYRQLSDEGYPDAMLQLAWCYEKGIGTRSNKALSEAWYRRAYEVGTERVKKLAIYYLGWFYLRGGDFVKAREIFNLGAEMDYPTAIFRLGWLYKRGDGVKKDLIKARALFERAACLGHILAKRDLAAMLMSGRFGILNAIKGFVLFFRTFKEVVRFSRRGGDVDDDARNPPRN